MPRAVLKNGLIVPRTPLPPDWKDGTELEVERVDASSVNETSNSDACVRLEAFVQDK